MFSILEAHEVAKLFRVPHSTLLDLSRGILLAVKIGKHGVPRADLEEWIRRRRDNT